jgi:TP901 family phage tail tape measure protein
MANSNKVVKRGVYLYLDGKEIKNDMQSIELEVKRLTKEIRSMTVGTEEYTRTAQKIRTLKGVLKEYRQEINKTSAEQKGLKFSFGNMVDGFNRFGGFIASIVATITGLVLGIRQLREESMKLEDSQHGLKALTGLDDDSIAWLTEEAKKLSTNVTEDGLRIRQSASEILDAFMLVGSAKPELLGDKEALEEVTVEAARLQAAARDINLNQAVDALTLSMNQYGASAEEASRYSNVLAAGSKEGAANIASEAAAIRNAGVAAASANVSIEQTVGLIQTLAYKGIKDEVAGTGLKKFFLTLQTGADDVNPKIVGLDKALENLANKNMDAADIKKMFGEEGYNTASVILQNIDMVKRYTAAVTDTSIAVEQAATNSNTASAVMAQARNELKLAGMELVEDLNPAILQMMNSLTSSTRVTQNVIKFLTEHRVTLGLLVAMIVTYNTWMNRKILLDKLSVLWNDKLKVAIMGVANAMKANPWMALVSVLVVATGAVIDYQRELSKVVKTQTLLNDLNEKAKTSVQAEKDELDRLLKVAKDEKRSKEEREVAIKKLNKISPEYLGNLTTETINSDNARKAVEKYTKALLLNAQAKQYADKLAEVRDKIQEMKKPEAVDEFYDFWRDEPIGWANQLGAALERAGQGFESLMVGGSFDGFTRMSSIEKKGYPMSGYDNALMGRNNALRELVDEEKILVGEYSKIQDELLKLSAEEEEIVKKKSGGGGEEDKELADRKRAMLDEEVRYQEELKAIKQKYLDDDLMTRKDYEKLVENAEMEHLKKILDIANLEPEKRKTIEMQLLDLMIKIKEKNREEESKIEEERIEENVNRRKKQYELELEELTRAYAKGALSEEAYHKNSQDVTEQYYKDLMDLYVDNEEKRSEIETKLHDLQLDRLKEAEREKQEEIKRTMDFVVGQAEELGDAMADVISGEEDAFKNLMKTMLMTAVEAIEYYVQLAVIKKMVEGILTGGLSLVSGLAQIAAIKAGFALVKGMISNFYTGGYTPGGAWDEPQGIVHSNEFVANRFAVSNPNIRPVLDLIDSAQRAGNVGNLTMDDVASVVNAGYAGVSSNGNVRRGASPGMQNDAEMKLLMRAMIVAMADARKAFEKPSAAYCFINGRGGISDAQSLVERMKNNVKRNKV